MRFRFPSPLSIPFPLLFTRFTDRRGPVEGGTWVGRSVLGTPMPYEIAVSEMNFNETSGPTYHLRVQARLEVLRRVWLLASPHYFER